MIINNEQVIYEKNMLRITKSTTKGKVYYDVRKLYEKNGELLPTRKGIMLDTECWKEILPILLEVLNEEETNRISE